MKKEKHLKQIIYKSIENILKRENKKNLTLNEIYMEVANYLEKDITESLKNQIRELLQERSFRCMISDDKNIFGLEKNKYIRYSDYTYITTDNNWRSATKVNFIQEKYKYETNQDLVYRAKLLIKYGTAKTDIIINELERIRKLLVKMVKINKVRDGYGTAFEVFAISNQYNIEYEEVIKKYMIIGDYDGKIDAIYYRDSFYVDIYQIKIGKINSDYYNIMQINYNKCVRGIIPKDGRDLFEFINKNISKLENKIINYKTISTNYKNIYNITPDEIYDKFFRNKLLPLSNNSLTLTILKPILNNDYNTYNITVVEGYNYSFYMRADELIKYILESLGVTSSNYDKYDIDLSKYFFDNVRGNLLMNKKMISTIINEPYNFINYNNGICIIGEVEDLGNAIKIKNPVISNGQQTIMTLIKLGINLDKILLLVRVINESDIIIKEKISRYMHDQVRVKEMDIFSLNPYIRDIQKKIYEKSYQGEKYFLNIYSSGIKECYGYLKQIYNKNNIIELSDYIKLYFLLENKKDLGNFKKSFSDQIDNLSINRPYEIEKSFRVCKSIKDYRDYISQIKDLEEKYSLKYSDLAFKYLLCKEKLTPKEAKIVIDMVNWEYCYKFGDKNKLNDIYMSPTIINKLEEQLLRYRKTLNDIKIKE